MKEESESYKLCLKYKGISEESEDRYYVSGTSRCGAFGLSERITSQLAAVVFRCNNGGNVVVSGVSVGGSGIDGI